RPGRRRSARRAAGARPDGSRLRAAPVTRASCRHSCRYRTTTVTLKFSWSVAQGFASPHAVRLAVIDAVPGVTALKKVPTGTQPNPGILGQFVGRGSGVVAPS